MKHSTLCLAALAALAAAQSDGGTTAWSPATAIDLTAANARRVAPVNVVYSPAFAGGSEDGGKVELLKISRYDTFQPSTQILVTASSPAVGAATLPAADAGTAFRLVLRAFDATDALVGEISADVGLGVASPFAAETLADMADEKLDRFIQTGATPQLAYSSAWVEGATSVAIDAALEIGAVKPVFGASAPADGTCEFIPAGEKRTRNAVRLHFLDSGDNEIGSPLVAYYTGIADPATVLFVR